MRHILTDLRGNPIYSFAQRHFRRIRHPHRPSTLLCLIENRSWDETIRRVRKYPSEILYRDDATGNTPLHIACRLDPPPAVIRALKSTSRVKNNEGATPLHVAASHRCSAESLAALIECASQQHKQDSTGLSGIPRGPPTADLSRMGRAPIHYACMSHRGLDLKAFQILFEESLKEGNLLLEPEKCFGLVDDFADDEILEDEDSEGNDPTPLVEVNVLALKDATGQTPLALLFRRYRERVKMIIRKLDRLHRQHQDNPNKAALAAAMTVHAELGGLWQKAGWIVARLSEERQKREGQCLGKDAIGCGYRCPSPGELAVRREAATWAMERMGASTEPIRPFVTSTGSDEDHIKYPSEHRRFRILHASVGLTGFGCPPEMIRLALSLHPHQVREMDEDGNLPIHIAMTATAFLAGPEERTPTAMAAAAAAAAVDLSDDMSILSEALSFFSSATVSQTANPFDKVIKLLLQHYPEGARIPQGQNGRLPLVAAIEARYRTWDDGLHTILKAYPRALHSRKIIPASLLAYIIYRVSSSFSDDNEPAQHAPSLNKRCRQGMAARTAVFELLRTKPDWCNMPIPKTVV